VASAGTALTAYERTLALSDQLDTLGVPRTWSVVQQGFHPFAPGRIAVLPSRPALRYPGHWTRDSLRRIAGRIARYRAELGRESADLPREKFASFFRVMDLIARHYRIPEVFEDWVVGPAARESLGSSAFGGHWGLIHQFQLAHEAPVDCPPVDWWLFLFPDGIDWASLAEEPVHALIGHVGRGPYLAESDLMYGAWGLTSAIMRAVDDARPVARIGRVGAARHLNRIAAECLKKHP
jgi:hypothetical protein